MLMILFCILNALSDIKILICDFAKEFGNIGLCIYEQKSKICLFIKSRKEFTVELDVNGVILTNKRKVKYLGLWLDSQFLWNTHINELYEKVYKHLNMLKILAGSSWGVHT